MKPTWNCSISHKHSFSKSYSKEHKKQNVLGSHLVSLYSRQVDVLLFME